MNSRVLISVLCIGAVAFACGPRARDESSATRKSATSLASADAAILQQGTKKTASKNSKTPVAAQLSVHTSESAIRLALRVVNTGTKRVEITFPSGQTHDFIILDSLGREVWRWANGRMFTQTLQNRLLSSGEALDVDETWMPAALTPGTYTARATLESENYPLARETEFIVTGATLASR